MHGGVIAAIPGRDDRPGDHGAGRRAADLGRHQGVTRALSPAGAARRRADRGGPDHRRKTRVDFEGAGELLLADGTVVAEAHAEYRKLDMDQIGDFDLQREKWAVRA